MHLESLIEDIGAFGPFQMRLITLLSLFKAIVVPTMLMMAFAGIEPDWSCQSLDNSSNTVFRNGSYRNCEWNSTCERRFDDAMVTVVSEWDLVCSKKWIGNTITSIQMAGVLIGAIISGYGSDSYGRKKMLYSGILLGTVGNLVAAFSVSWIMFTIVRFILGVAVGLSLSVIYLYQVEFVGKRWRGFIASLPSWAIGVVVFAGLAWVIRNWKWMHLAVTVIYFPFLLTWCYVPESLRWLTVKGHLKDARIVINRIAAVNKKPVPDTSILELIAAEEKAEGDKAKNYNYLDLLKTKNIARRTCFTCFIWFSMSVVYYSISFGVKNLAGDFYLNFMIMALLELPTFLVVLCVVYLFERRTAAAIMFVSSSLSSFGFAIATRLAPEDIKVPLENGLALTAKFFAVCAWGVSQAMTSEQFPTVIRNLAFAAQNTSARIGGVLAAQLLSLGAKNDLMPPFVAMGVLTSITAMICFTLEETSKKALEDTMQTYTIAISSKEVTEKRLHNNDFGTEPNGLAVTSGDMEMKSPEEESALQYDDSDIATNKDEEVTALVTASNS